MAMPCVGEGVDGVLAQSGRVLDAVDAGRGEVAQGLLAEAVRRDADPLLVRGGDGVGDGLARPARREVADVAVDPVADELDPAVAAVRLEPDVADELVLLDLVGVVADVAAGAGDVPAGADDLRQVLALVDPVRVAGLPGVADEQRAAVAVGDRLLLRLLARHAAVRSEPDVAVGVDEAREHPALERLHVGVRSVGGVNDTRRR